MRKPHENELGELHELATLLDTWQPESPETDLWPLLATQASGDQASDPRDEFTLTAEQERGLAQRIERGGADAEKAREVLVNANLRLVTSIAKMYENKDIAMADLIQEGTLGLLHAAEKYDGRRGFRFSTYATPWIRQAVGRAVEGKGRTIRLPESAVAHLELIRQARTAFATMHGRLPTPAELAAASHLAQEHVELLLEVSGSTRLEDLLPA